MAVTVSWEPYPSDVPIGDRLPCAAADCGKPGEIVEVRSPSTVQVVSLIQETTTTVWCIDDARQHGYEDAPAPPPPAQLNALQRWIVRALGGTDRAPSK
jgi:hypothetical protein